MEKDYVKTVKSSNTNIKGLTPFPYVKTVKPSNTNIKGLTPFRTDPFPQRTDPFPEDGFNYVNVFNDLYRLRFGEENHVINYGSTEQIFFWSGNIYNNKTKIEIIN